MPYTAFSIYHKLSKDAVKAHENKVRVVGLQKSTRNVTSRHVTVFISIYCALDENGLGCNSWGSSFLFCNMFTLNAAVCASTSFDLPSPFLCEEHEQGKGIMAIIASESVRIAWTKAVQCVKLREFFSHSRITARAKLFKTRFQTVLFFVGWSNRAKWRLVAVWTMTKWQR